MNAMTIGKLATAGGVGVGVETIRFYQRKGLLTEPDRNGAVRRYGLDDLKRLRFIRSAQKAGFTLAEIQELLALDAGEDHARARKIAQARVEALNLKIAELTNARDALKRLATKCSAAIDEACPILSAFEDD